MDEFLQDINSLVYIEWILLQNGKNKLTIEKRDQRTIVIENDVVKGKIIFYGNGIFEEELTDRKSDQKIFYLHFQLTYFNHAVELFNEMINCAKEAINRPSLQVLLCCSGGLTTTLFAHQMQELAKLEKLPFKIEATGYSRIFEIGDEYDVILVAPQVGYMVPQAKRRLPGKKILLIPTRIFATNDFSGALKLISEEFDNKEEEDS